MASAALDMDQTECIANAEQCQNPLFLRVLLDITFHALRHTSLSFLLDDELMKALQKVQT
jgi:hypothetical protein